MDEVKLKPVIVSDGAGKPVAVQVDLVSFQHMLELLAALLRDGRTPLGIEMDDPLLARLAGLLERDDEDRDPREQLEDLLDSVTLLCAKADPTDYVDYEAVRSELLELDKL